MGKLFIKVHPPGICCSRHLSQSVVHTKGLGITMDIQNQNLQELGQKITLFTPAYSDTW